MRHVQQFDRFLVAEVNLNRARIKTLQMVYASDKLPWEQEGVWWLQRVVYSRMNSSGRRWGCWRAAAGR